MDKKEWETPKLRKIDTADATCWPPPPPPPNPWGPFPPFPPNPWQHS